MLFYTLKFVLPYRTTLHLPIITSIGNTSPPFDPPGALINLASKGDSLQKSHHHGQAIAPWRSQPEGSIITVQGDLRDLHVELLTAHRVSDREKPAAVGRAERLS